MNYKIKLVSDSTCDLSQELIEKMQIEIVPLYVNFGEESYLDGENLSTERMYKMIEIKNTLPKTAAASPGRFEEVFRKYLEMEYVIIYVGIGSKFSATFQSAYAAAHLLDQASIHLVDSMNLSSGSGLLLLKASAMIEKGLKAAEIVTALNEMKLKVRSQFVIDTLDYLYKGGRLNALSASLGTVLRIKPIIKVRDGVMAVGKKGRGSLKNGIDLMLDEMLHYKENIDLEYCMITHSFSDQNTSYIQNFLQNNFQFKNIYITNAGCVISSHCGKGTIGVLYILK